MDQRREDREQKKEDAQKNAADDMMDNMSDDDWLKSETEFAGMKMTGQQWRDFAKRNRLHQAESDAYAISKGATQEGVDKSNAALRVFEKDRSTWTDEDKAIVREAEQDPEAREALGLKKEWSDLKITANLDHEQSAPPLAQSDVRTSIRDSGIEPNVDLMGSWNAANRAPSVEDHAINNPAPKPEPAPAMGGYSFG